MQRVAVIITSAFLAATSGAAVAAGGDPAAGRAKSQACVACHGERGDSPTQQVFPRLAGQHESYLYQALRQYKSGARENPVMAGMVSNLSDQDMRDLAAYFASQQGLGTVSVRRTNE